MTLEYKLDDASAVQIDAVEWKVGNSIQPIYTIEYRKDGTHIVTINLILEGSVTKSFVSYQYLQGRGDSRTFQVGTFDLPPVKYKTVELVSKVTTGAFHRRPGVSGGASTRSFFQPFVEYTDNTRSEWDIFTMNQNRSYNNTRTENLNNKEVKRIGIMAKVDNNNYQMTVSSYSLTFKFSGIQ